MNYNFMLKIMILNHSGLGRILTYLYGVQVVGGSNPLTPTNENKGLDL